METINALEAKTYGGTTPTTTHILNSASTKHAPKIPDMRKTLISNTMETNARPTNTKSEN